MTEAPRNDRDRLLAETISDGWDSPDMQRLAQRAARSVRRRRMAARTLPAAACIATALIVAYVARHTPLDRTHPRPSTVAAAPAPFETISDDELLGLLGNTPVLVLREHGQVASVVWLENEPTAGSIE